MQPDASSLNEIAAEDIAELAGVTSSAVSNWSRREPDFPDPSRTEGRRKLYERSEILAWLERNRPESHDHDRLDDREMWQLANAARGSVSFTDLMQSLAWITAAVRTTEPLPEDPSELADLVGAIAGPEGTALDRIARSELGPHLIAQMRSLARQIAYEDGLPLERFVDMAVTNRPTGERGTTDELLDDLIDAAAIGETDEILDPAAGVGQLLRRVHGRTGASQLEGRYESNTNLDLACAINAARNVPGQARLADPVENVPPAAQYDRVISLTPHRLSKMSSAQQEHDTVDPDDPRWLFAVPRAQDSWEAALQRALWEATNDGVVVFAVADIALSGLSSQRARAAATNFGAIVAVIGTRHLFPGTNIPLSFVIASRPAERDAGASTVLMVDLTQDTEPDRRLDWQLWVRGEVDPSDSRCVSVPVDDLATHDFILEPARYVKPPRSDVDTEHLALRLPEEAANAHSAVRALDHVLAMVALPSFDPQRADWRTATLGELAAQKIIHIAIGRGRRSASGSGRHPLLTAQHLEEPCRHTPELCDLDEGPSTEIVRAGDLIIRLDHEPHTTMTVTDHQDGWALGAGLARIRPDRSGTTAELGWIASWTTSDQFQADCERLSVGNTIRRLSPHDLRRIEVPLPPIAVQRAAADYQRIIADLEAVSCAARQAVDDLIETNTQLLNAHLVDPVTSADTVTPAALNKVVRRRRRSTAAGLLGIDFHLRHRQIEAKGRPFGDRFRVYGGAQARPVATDSLPALYKRLRQELLDERVLVQGDDALILSEDYTFDSATAAAAVLTGTSTNGLQAWVDGRGQTLKQHLGNSSLGR